MSYHVPVMVDEVVQGLVTNPGGLYLDVTVGGGGHSKAILQTLQPAGRLVAIDRDVEAVQFARQVFDQWSSQAEVLHAGFAALGPLLKKRKIGAVHGVLFDLGVSSHQIDEPARGFSYQEEGPLDMRMDRQQGVAAADIVKMSSEMDLAQIIKKYGEEFQARRIARSICQFRRRGDLETTADLRKAVEATNPRHLGKTLARVFQAFRIVVNGELEQLEKGLEATINCLIPGGRLAVIAYHSLEDRLVKTRLAKLVKGCICPPDFPVCACGKTPQFKSTHRKAQRAGKEEVQANRRSRSAILRIYEKI